MKVDILREIYPNIGMYAYIIRMYTKNGHGCKNVMQNGPRLGNVERFSINQDMNTAWHGTTKIKIDIFSIMINMTIGSTNTQNFGNQHNNKN